MGIPKLTSRLAHYKTYRDGAFIRGADLYIDGKNFVHSGEEFFAREGMLAVLQRNLRLLESLEPRSITIYFDASFPLEKMAVKLSRCAGKLGQKTWDNLTEGTALALDEIRENFPGIQVVMTGSEAEDEIFWDLSASAGAGAGAPRIVFSSDSDCFTFEVPDVRIVSLGESRNWPDQFITYDLEDVLRSTHVAQYRHLPTKPLGKSVRGVQVDIRQVELVNMWETYGRAIMFLSLLPTDLQDPWRYSQKWRAAAYGLLLAPGTAVEEYRQQTRVMHAVEVRALERGLAGELVRDLDRDIAELIYETVVESDLPHPPLALRAYLRGLEASHEYNIQSAVPPGSDMELYGACKLWCAAAAAISSSLRLLSSASGRGTRGRLEWKLNPRELYEACVRVRAGAGAAGAAGEGAGEGEGTS